MLTARERQILRGWRNAQSNKQIAATLGLKTNTIANYTTTLFQKIHVTNRAQAVLWALDHPKELEQSP